MKTFSDTRVCVETRSWHTECNEARCREGHIKSYHMKFIFEVGEIEKHQVEFNYNQLAGRVMIKVDKQIVRNSIRLLNEPAHEVYQFVVGQMIKTEVRIVKWRKQLLGARNCFYVDGRLVDVRVGA